MSRPGPAAALETLSVAVAVDSPPREARDILADICLSQEWVESTSEAAEKGEAWEEGFLERARRQVNELEANGRPSPFTFNSSSEYMIQGAAFIEPADDEAARQAKVRILQESSYANAIANLTPREFEMACGETLRLLGVRDPVVTRQSGDEGIDFHGLLHLEDVAEEFFPSVRRQLRVWIVGQAKQYPTGVVSTFEIRELVGAVELARGQAFSSENHPYASLLLRACDPVFYLFITTGRLSPPSWTLVTKSGVIAMDGQMLARFLASHGVGCDDSGSFDPKLLTSWISGL